MKWMLGTVTLVLACAGQAESLPQAWRDALTHNRALAAQALRAQAAQHELAATQALSGVSVGAALDARRFDRAPTARADLSPLTSQAQLAPLGLPASVDIPLSDRSSTLADLSIALPLYTGGRLDALAQAATLGVQAANLQHDAGAQSLKLAVAAAYLDVLKASAAREVADMKRASLAAYRRDVDNFYREGVVAKVDVLGAELALAEAQQQLIGADNALTLARAAYNRWLGRALDAPVTLDEPQLAPETRAYPALWAAAQAQRHELQALSALARSRSERAASVRAEARPQLGAYAAYSWLDNPLLAHKGVASLGVGMKWDVFDSGLVQARAAAIQGEAEAIAAEREDMVSRVALEIDSALSEQRNAAAQQQLAASALAAAVEHLAIQRDRYANGLANQTEVLSAQTQRADSQRRVNDARYARMLATFKLKRAVGEL